MIHKIEALLLVTAIVALSSTSAAAQTCGDGAIDDTEGCDDGNLRTGDGCGLDCAVEMGWTCVPSLFATGVSGLGIALSDDLVDPHWVWSLSADGSDPQPAVPARNAAWADLPPGRWLSTDAAFGTSLTTQPDTYWFQDVYMPAAFVGALTFDVAVAADNEAEVFVNGTSYGTAVGFGAATTVPVPASAFTSGFNTISVRLREYAPGTPRGILVYPGGAGILSQCTHGCYRSAVCDDRNDCTADGCYSSACEHRAVEVGTACGGGTDICGEPAPLPACVACVDSETGDATDLGCTEGMPYCAPTTTGRVACAVCTEDLGCDEGWTCTAGACVESDATPDAGSPDAGFVDAGPATPGDAGVPPRIDAGAVTVDAGPVTPAPGTEDGGCGCHVTTGSAPIAWSWFAAVGALLWRRRRR